MLKPSHLKTGSTILTLSLSWGGPGAIPSRYEAGKQQLQNEFGVHIIEGSYTLSDPDFVYKHPELRAKDLMDGFTNPEVDAIFSTIGGEESIRMLPYIDFDVIKQNPKIFMGYSDSTVTHFMCQKAGLVSFYGPSIMSGFAENTGMFPYMINAVRKTLFTNNPIGIIKPNDDGRTNERLERDDPKNQLIKRKLHPSTGWRWIQGQGVANGVLRGGCVDIFPFVIGTSIRPDLKDRKDTILIIETSEERMSKVQFERIMRNLGSQGILKIINGIILGRSQHDDTTGKQINYDNTLIKIVTQEFGRPDMPIVTNMDFGHTDPMMVLPLGCQAQIDYDRKQFSVLENACE